MSRFFWGLLLLVSTAHGQDNLGFVQHNHLALHVKDIPTSARFYSGVLGLKPVPVPDNLRATRAWFDVGNGQMIHLLDGRTEPIVHDRNGSHIALFVSDIGKSEVYLKSRNLVYHRQVRFDGVVQLYFADPDGYLFELNEYKPTAQARPDRSFRRIAAQGLQTIVNSILD